MTNTNAIEKNRADVNNFSGFTFCQIVLPIEKEIYLFQKDSDLLDVGIGELLIGIIAIDIMKPISINFS
jgi:hypothetical protein